MTRMLVPPREAEPRIAARAPLFVRLERENSPFNTAGVSSVPLIAVGRQVC